MKLVKISDIEKGMYLGQNIYRHDSLLALPKGVKLGDMECRSLTYYNIDYVLVVDEDFAQKKKRESKYHLEVIEEAYRNNTILNKAYGLFLYDEMEKLIIKNKKVQLYLSKLKRIDSYSFSHSVNISIIIASMLKRGGVDTKLAYVVLLSLLHDVGRIKIGNIVNKMGRLTNDEYELLREHPYESFQLLKKAGYNEHDLRFVLETHENWDGSGYPNHLKEKEITFIAQLIHVAEFYNALSNFRPYREAFSPFEVLQFLQEEKGKKFSEEIVQTFIEKFSPYKKGLKVELNNGEIGIVKRVLKYKRTLPIVDILCRDKGVVNDTIDLSMDKNVRIRRVLKIY